MSDTDELLREVDELTTEESSGPEQSEFEGDVDAGGSVDPDAGQTSGSGGLRSRAAGKAASMFSPKAFLVAAVLAGAGTWITGAIPILPNLPVVGSAIGLLGIFLGTMLYGTVSGDRRYAESAVAGGAIAGLGAFQGLSFLTVATGLAVPIFVVMAGLGVIAGVVGQYFGRDLRAGLTGDLPDGGP